MSEAHIHAAVPSKASKNPWTRENWNTAQQQRIAAISLVEARKFARAAGTTLDNPDPPPPVAADGGM